MCNALLKVEDLTKQFGGLLAVNKVNFEVYEGEILAIIGPNGAGKTSIFNLISKLMPATSGSVHFLNENITGLKSYQVAARGITRTFQATSLFDQLRVVDNLAIGRRVRTRTRSWDAILHNSVWKKDKEETTLKVMMMLGFIGLQEKPFHFVSSLSQEEQKRLAIGVALMSDPKIILLDEPCGGINNDETEGITQLIRNIKEAGITVCLIEHKMRMVMGLADRIVVLNYGCKIAEGEPQEIRSNPTVIEAYLGGGNHC
ncbi:MAG: ABC transporter ATP-binding protein [Dethiobacter sp.]|jgi:ABC-type branched-subunit amino acid transport system ATPase component|nr:ABC transporter ATP-binding protein [Dethiobacter sp.]